MNESDFRKRIYSNPLAPDEEILSLANGDPKLSKILEQTQHMEKGMHDVLSTIAVPSGLKDRLMAIPNSENAEQAPSHTLQSLSGKPAANSNYFQYFAVAASLVLALGVSFSLTFAPDNGPSSAEIAFGNEVLLHLYHEDFEINSINDGNELPSVDMPMIRNVMAPVGTQLNKTPIAASVKFAKRCIIVPAFDSAHLILQGSQGAVSVFVINNSPVSVEYSINDERFSGVVMPMDKGNMILVGESNADLSEYKKLVSESVDWVI